MLKIISGGSAYGARLTTDQPFRRGEVIYHISGYRVTEAPTYQTIQVGHEQHIEELGVIAYLNHSCQPNFINPHIREMIFETLVQTVEVERRTLRAAGVS